MNGSAKCCFCAYRWMSDDGIAMSLGMVTFQYWTLLISARFKKRLKMEGFHDIYIAEFLRKYNRFQILGVGRERYLPMSLLTSKKGTSEILETVSLNNSIAWNPVTRSMLTFAISCGSNMYASAAWQQYELARTSFNRSKESLHPSQWTFLPPTHEIIPSPWPSFHKWEKHFDREPTANSITVPSAASLIAERRYKLASLLHSTLSFLGIELPSPSSDTEIDSSYVNLAIAAFRWVPKSSKLRFSHDHRRALVGFPHPVGRTTVGWEHAGPYQPNEGDPESPSGAVRMAWMLVQLAGFDPQTTVASEMDASDPRYICGLCPIHSCRGKPVYN